MVGDTRSTLTASYWIVRGLNVETGLPHRYPSPVAFSSLLRAIQGQTGHDALKFGPQHAAGIQISSHALLVSTRVVGHHPLDGVE